MRKHPKSVTNQFLWKMPDKCMPALNYLPPLATERVDKLPRFAPEGSEQCPQDLPPAR